MIRLASSAAGYVVEALMMQMALQEAPSLPLNGPLLLLLLVEQLDVAVVLLSVGQLAQLPVVVGAELVLCAMLRVALL